MLQQQVGKSATKMLFTFDIHCDIVVQIGLSSLQVDTFDVKLFAM